MAKLKPIVDATESTRPAKKAIKAKLSFPVKAEETKETVHPDTVIPTVDNLPVPAEKEIEQHPIVNEAKLEMLAKQLNQSQKETIDLALNGKKEEAPKAPNFPAAVKDSKPVERTIASKEAISPVEEVKGHTKLVQNHNLHASKQGNKDGKHFTSREFPPITGQYPEHMVELALIIKNNAEIRRFTSLGILNYLLQKGEIKGDKRYVSFKWNKFTVKAGNLVKEYDYSEPFFLNCFVASFSSFSSSAQRTINNFTKKELNLSIGEAVDGDEVEVIATATENR